MKTWNAILVTITGCLCVFLLNWMYANPFATDVNLFFGIPVCGVLLFLSALKISLDNGREASELLVSFRQFFLWGKGNPRSVLLEKYFDDLLDYYSPGKGYDLFGEEKGPFAQLSTKFLNELFNHDEVRFAFCSKVRQKIKAEQLWHSMEMEKKLSGTGSAFHENVHSRKWQKVERSVKRQQALFALQEKISKLSLATPLEISDPPLILVPKDGQ